jgi:hypothetical protein
MLSWSSREVAAEVAEVAEAEAEAEDDLKLSQF